MVQGWCCKLNVNLIPGMISWIITLPGLFKIWSIAWLGKCSSFLRISPCFVYIFLKVVRNSEALHYVLFFYMFLVPPLGKANMTQQRHWFFRNDSIDRSDGIKLSLFKFVIREVYLFIWLLFVCFSLFLVIVIVWYVLDLFYLVMWLQPTNLLNQRNCCMVNKLHLNFFLM